MNHEQGNPSTTWPQHFQEESMVGDSAAQEDFSNFLDLGTDFPNFDALEIGQDTMNVDVATMPTRNMMDMQDMQDAAYSLGGQPHAQQLYSHGGVHPQMTSHGYQVPLTPLSAGMHGHPYMQQLDDGGHAVYDGAQVSFTPLVSPAQTPLDSAFCMPEFASANDFFSPLNSPAIEAQHAFSSAQIMSPVDFASDPSLPRGSKTVGVKKGQRKPASTTRTPARSIKQSPAMKPQSRRRPTSITAVPQEILEGIQKEASASQGLKPSSGQNHALGSSESSVSPEPLTEPLMPPPALPKSAGKSPQSVGQTRDGGTNEPATPATLMRIPSTQIQAVQASGHPGADAVPGGVMEDIVLPASAIPALPPTLPRVNTSRSDADDEQRTPNLPAKSAKLSASSTPRTSAMSYQNTPSEESYKLRRSESSTGIKAGKKRQGASSATISPALRPKISPNINPLMPAPGPGAGSSILSAETTALYLASKSNYQNILEGTHLPGVSYPEALAENLSFKRTSHKLAEQGRRNRINTALKEIENLLPPSILAVSRKERGSPNENEDGDKASSAGTSASKASTVEMACLYIRALQEELLSTKKKLATSEQQLADSRRSQSETSE